MAGYQARTLAWLMATVAAALWLCSLAHLAQAQLQDDRQCKPEVNESSEAHNHHGNYYVCEIKNIPNGSDLFCPEDFHNNRGIETLAESAELTLFGLNFTEVALPFVIAIILIITTFLRMALASSKRLKDLLPDSCVVIIVGILCGTYLKYQTDSNDQPFTFSAETFFLFVLPPIIFEAGYIQANNHVFMANIGTILANAILGTTFNTFAMGYGSYAAAQALNIEMRPIEGLVFGSLIAAVDPVAVLTVFEEMHVNPTLHTMVFGESILNDGVAVVLYRICVALAYESAVPGKELDVGSSFGLGIASFVIVFVGGLLVGLIHGLFSALATRFHLPERARVAEPFVLILIGYMSYLVAELFHFSGIVSIMVCGMVMQHYAVKNIHKESRISIDYFLTIISRMAETLVFILLGIELVNEVGGDGFGTTAAFAFIAFVLTLLFRFIWVFISSYFINRFRQQRISVNEQVILGYSGLRGAIAFALVFILLEQKLACVLSEDTASHSQAVNDVPEVPFFPFKNRELFLDTTIIIVMLTIFGQGSTISMLIDKLKIARLSEDDDETDHSFETLNLRVIDHSMHVVQQVMNAHSGNIVRDYYYRIDALIRHYLVKKGASYRNILDKAEEHFIKCQLKELRASRLKNIRQEEDALLRDYELENDMRRRNYDMYQAVMVELEQNASDLAQSDHDDHTTSLVASVSPENAPSEDTRLSPTSQDRRHQQSVVKHLLRAATGRDDRETHFGTGGELGQEALYYYSKGKAESQDGLDMLRRHAEDMDHGTHMHHRRHRPQDAEDARSNASLLSTDTVTSGLLRANELEEARRRLRRAKSDSNLANTASRAKAFIAGETWIPMPPSAPTAAGGSERLGNDLGNNMTDFQRYHSRHGLYDADELIDDSLPEQHV